MKTFPSPFFLGDIGLAQREQHIIESIETTVASIFNKRILSLMLVLVVMVIIFGSLIWLIEKRNNHFERGFQGFLSSLWWSAVTMTTVGYGDKVPITNSGRLIAFIWMLCSIMTIAIFTASITSALTVRQLNNSDYSLSNYKQNQVGTISNSASEEFLKRNFFRNIERYPEFKMGLNALTDKEIELFIYDRPWLVYQIQNNPDYKDLELLPMRFNMQSYAMPMRKNIDLDFKHKISSALIELLETNDWQLLLKEYEVHQD